MNEHWVGAYLEEKAAIIKEATDYQDKLIRDRIGREAYEKYARDCGYEPIPWLGEH